MSATAGSVRTGTRHETTPDTRSASSPGRSSASASATSVGSPGAASRPNTSSSRSDNPTVRDVTRPVPYHDAAPRPRGRTLGRVRGWGHAAGSATPLVDRAFLADQRLQKHENDPRDLVVQAPIAPLGNEDGAQ